MEERVVNISPGLYKIFDEILVNAIDHYVRNNKSNGVSQIRIDIDKETGIISIYNNGAGFPIHVHKEHDMYIPEMVLGNLLAGENFDDSEKDKIVGGRNGIGAKLTNIYSVEFIIETVDATIGKKYVQRFSENMYKKDTPKITAYKSAPYTKITFKPDYTRFSGMTGLDDDIISVLEKRAYDASACTGKDLSVWLNDKKLEVKSFADYTGQFLAQETPRIYEQVGEYWEVVVALNPEGDFKQISFVNGVSTFKGGKHVDFVSNHIARKLQNYLANRGRNKIQLKQEMIKKNMWLFLRCNIDKPKFDSQTKEFMTTESKDFGSKFEISDKFIEKLAKTGIVERALALSEFKENNKLVKTVSSTTGKKGRRITDIEKLDDAEWAGSDKSAECVLILTEGDSAKALAVAGLSVVGNQRFGAFPLRGKLLNVRDVSLQKALANEEVKNLIRILGLELNKKYTTVSELRYGKIMLFTDQDLDGAHIKGLIINFIDSYWPDLLSPEMKETFVIGLPTPIVVAIGGKSVAKQIFYNLQDYRAFKDSTDMSKWDVKYYKGLGTSTAADAKEYFKDFDGAHVRYLPSTATKEALVLAFDKTKADDRKEWIKKCDHDQILEPSRKDVPFEDFINHDLIHFSVEDCVRSIPSICDGQKPSQRKVLFGVFKRNLRKDVKVAQLAGYISEHAAYHHGEASLHGTIVGLAQNFVGSNNINLLEPSGQFGTRLMGGKDSASPRYIFTRQTRLTRVLFNESDDALFDYLDDDGLSIEPRWYLPIIPMILVNGTTGIGTGYSTDIPCYNPMDIVENIRALMEGHDVNEMKPWYRGFTGMIDSDSTNNSYRTVGKYRKIDATTVEITELPIGEWTEHYKKHMELLMQGEWTTKSGEVKKTNIKIQSYIVDPSECSIRIVVKFSKDMLEDYSTFKEEFEKEMHLAGSISLRNMHLYNRHGVITKYDSVLDILKEYYEVRLEYYLKRKIYLLTKLKRELDIIAAKVRFIEEIISGKIIVNKKKRREIMEQLEKHGYPKFATSVAASIKKNSETDDNADATDNNVDDEDNKEQETEYNYNYLLQMQIYSLTEERIEKLKREHEKKKAEYAELEKKSDKDLWREDLDVFEKEYKTEYDEYMKQFSATKPATETKKRKINVKTKNC